MIKLVRYGMALALFLAVMVRGAEVGSTYLYRLRDVRIDGTQTNSQVIGWDSSASIWKPITVSSSSGGTITNAITNVTSTLFNITLSGAGGATNAAINSLVGGGTISTNAITNLTSSAGFTITRTGTAQGATNADVGLTTDTPQFARLGLGTAADANNTLTISNSTISSVPLTVNAFAGTTNDLFKVNSGGTNYVKVRKDGFLSLGQVSSGSSTATPVGINLGSTYADATVSSKGKIILYDDGSGSIVSIGVSSGQLNNFASGAGYFKWYIANAEVFSISSGTVKQGADASSVVTPQTWKAADGSGTDKAGADFQLEGGQSTGTGRAGAVILRTGETLTTSSSANAYITRFYLSAKPVDLTNATAVLVFNVSLASGKTCGLHVFATTRVDDGTDFQGATDDFTCVAVNKAGTVSIGSISTSLGSTVATSGTISTVWTAVANGSGVDVKCNQTTTVITPTTRRVRWRVETDSNDTALAVTPQ